MLFRHKLALMSGLSIRKTRAALRQKCCMGDAGAIDRVILLRMGNGGRLSSWLTKGESMGKFGRPPARTSWTISE